MLYREIIAVCSEIHTKHINALCEQKVEFFLCYNWWYTSFNHWILKEVYSATIDCLIFCFVFQGY
jgi:hypothetical protein